MKTEQVAVKAKAKAGDFMPTKDELLVSGASIGGVVAGIVAGHALVTVTKKDSLLVNGGLLVGGFYGACKVKQPFLKMMCVGVATYGGLKLVGAGVKAATEAVAPGTTGGLSGMLPDSVKEALRKYIPSFAGVDEIAGLGNADDYMNGTDDEFGNLSLDDQGSRDTYAGTEEYAGIGDAMQLVA